MANWRDEVEEAEEETEKVEKAKEAASDDVMTLSIQCYVHK